MKRFVPSFLALLFATACGDGDPCQEAADKLEECGFGKEVTVGDGECSKHVECLAECLVDATCSDGGLSEEDSEFIACVVDCDG